MVVFITYKDLTSREKWKNDFKSLYLLVFLILFINAPNYMFTVIGSHLSLSYTLCAYTFHIYLNYVIRVLTYHDSCFTKLASKLLRIIVVQRLVLLESLKRLYSCLKSWTTRSLDRTKAIFYSVIIMSLESEPLTMFNTARSV